MNNNYIKLPLTNIYLKGCTIGKNNTKHVIISIGNKSQIFLLPLDVELNSTRIIMKGLFTKKDMAIIPDTDLTIIAIEIERYIKKFGIGSDITINTLKNQLVTMQNDTLNLINIHIDRINTIISDATTKKYRELRFKTPISYKNINEVYYEDILYIGIADRNYIIITRHDTSEYLLTIKALKIEMLFSIIEQLEMIQSFNDVKNYLI